MSTSAPEADSISNPSTRSGEQSPALAWASLTQREIRSEYPSSAAAQTNTDSTPFPDLVAAVSLGRTRRRAYGGWDPHWHQPPTSITFTDNDFLLGSRRADHAWRRRATLGAR